MSKAKLIVKLEEIVSGICQLQGVVLYDIVFESGGKQLKIFIDKEDGTGSVQLEDCEKVSKACSEIFDEQELIPGEADYQLEVSSPGVERKLNRSWHFERVIDKKIEVKLYEVLGNIHPEAPKKWHRAKTVQGILKEAGPKGFSLEIDGGEFHFDYQKLAKAHVVFDFGEVKNG